MRWVRPAAWGLLVLGLASLAYAGLQGDLDVFVVVLVPVVAGSGPWAALGLLATIVAIAALSFTSLRRGIEGRGPPGGSRQPGQGHHHRPGGSQPPSGEAEPETRSGGVILLGPIPIAWGSDRSTLGWLVLAGLALTLAAIGLTLVLRA